MHDIIDALDQINSLLEDRTFEYLIRDRTMRAAFERFLEILSEASRHIPEEMKSKRSDMEWPRIAAIGNHLRHAYHRVDTEILWRLYADGTLAELREAVSRFLTTDLRKSGYWIQSDTRDFGVSLIPVGLEIYVLAAQQSPLSGS